jgi:hypothetical protein
MCAGSRHPSIGIDEQDAGGTAETQGRVHEGLTGTLLPNFCLIIRQLPNSEKLGGCLILPNFA